MSLMCSYRNMFKIFNFLPYIRKYYKNVPYGSSKFFPQVPHNIIIIYLTFPRNLTNCLNFFTIFVESLPAFSELLRYFFQFNENFSETATQVFLKFGFLGKNLILMILKPTALITTPPPSPTFRVLLLFTIIQLIHYDFFFSCILCSMRNRTLFQNHLKYLPKFSQNLLKVSVDFLKFVVNIFLKVTYVKFSYSFLKIHNNFLKL